MSSLSGLVNPLLYEKRNYQTRFYVYKSEIPIDIIQQREFFTNDFFEKQYMEKFLPRMSEEPKSFAMYNTKKEKIVEFLRRNGAEVVSVEEDGRCGWEWIGFCYYIRKE